MKMYSMKLTCIFLFSIILMNVSAQDSETEHYRELGYLARISNNFDSSIYCYTMVLKINSFDYDAHLALARLYFDREDYVNSWNHYHSIFVTDSTDAEAILGFAKILLRKGEYSTSAYYFDKVIKPELPYLPFYLDKAKTLIYQDKLDSAILVFRKTIEIDEKCAEAWAGIGKMYYWQNKPFQALNFYQKALELEPGNQDYLQIYNNLRKETAFGVTITSRSIMEKEESYRIDALVNTVSLSKRLTDKFLLSAVLLYDFSDKDYEWQTNDTARWFNNLRLTATYLGKKNRFTVFGGYSQTDRIFSSYGAYYSDVWRINKIRIYNTTALSYDYFYYWNKVGQDYLSDNLALTYNKLTFNGSFRYGIVRKNEIADFEQQKYEPDKNPYYTYAFSLRYKLFKEPSLTIGLNYSFMDFTYKSPLYYTPKNRHLSGISIGLYKMMKDKFYFYAGGSYNIGRELYFEESSINPGTIISQKMNVDNINWESEIGYNIKKLSFSAGYSGFINPYYANRVVYLSSNILL